MEEYKKISSRTHPHIFMRIIPGHFVTANSHINYYVDISMMKSRQNEAQMIADAIAEHYITSTVIDTILCLDGCEVIGAYLANALSGAGIISMNAHKTIYITTPEFSHTGQMLFRENMQPMIREKHVLLLVASASTGKTLNTAVNTIQYYGGRISGISSIFSAIEAVQGYRVNTLFTPSDLPGYTSFTPIDCDLCKENIPIDAIVNDYGFARL